MIGIFKPGATQRTSMLGLCLTSLLFVAPTALAEKDRLVIDLSSEPSTLDPHMDWNPDSYYVYRNIFDNLYARDANGNIVGHLVRRHEYKNDTHILLYLREGVQFHDGRALTAEDVAYSINRIIDPTLGSPQAGQFNKIVEARVLDSNLVEIITDGPYPALFDQLVKLSVVPKHYVENVGSESFNQHPVGSGPYIFENWRRGSAVTLSRNESYWNDSGRFGRVMFRAVPDLSTRVANLRSGTSDLVVKLNSDMVSQLKGQRELEILSVDTVRVAYLRLNTTRPPLNDYRVRRALAHAINKDAIVRGLLGGFGKVADVMVTPEQFGWIGDVNAPEYDPTRAQELLEKTDAAGNSLVLATSPVFDSRVVQAIQHMLNNIGFDVRILTSDMASYLEKVRNRGPRAPHLNFGRWSCGCQDADNVLYPLLHSSSSWSGVDDPEIDQALEAARSTLNDAERRQLYEQVHERVAKQTLLIPLYQVAAIYGARESLEWRPTPYESMFITRMSWAP